MARLVTFGEVMMRLTPPGRKKLLQTDNLTITYGGAEANVSCALAHWGLESAHVTSFPNNALGDAAIATLRKLNVSTEFMIKQEGRLGLYFVEAGAMNRATAITYDRLPSAFSAIDAKKIKVPIITPEFKDYKDGKLKMISFFAKKARGLMVRYAIDHQLQNPEDLKNFDYEGYRFDESLSKNNQWVFTR